MNELVLTGSIAALGAGAVTGVGSLPIYFVSHITQRVKAGFFGFASGIMLAASFFSLLIPGIEQGQIFWGSKAAGVGAALIGFLFGGSFVHWSSRLLLHDDALIHAVFKQKDDSGILRRVFLIVFTITMHNFPEGLSIGVSYGAGNAERSLALAQNWFTEYSRGHGHSDVAFDGRLPSFASLCGCVPCGFDRAFSGFVRNRFGDIFSAGSTNCPWVCRRLYDLRCTDRDGSRNSR